ncbi:MAG: GNAT family N-acetyltransferase [Ruminococcus sp.]|nr:MAG: GNAT family N-acetyltransferase [Ruminococcus sp.]
MRRKGIGDSLLEAFICALPDTAEEIALEVRESNAPAIAIYEKKTALKALVSGRISTPTPRRTESL